MKPHLTIVKNGVPPIPLEHYRLTEPGVDLPLAENIQREAADRVECDACWIIGFLLVAIAGCVVVVWS